MKFGYIKTALCSPDLKVADVKYNVSKIIDAIGDASSIGVELIVFPELSVSGCTCQSLFNSQALLDGVINGIKEILVQTSQVNALIFVGAPIKKDGKNYNVALAINKGKILAVIPQEYSVEGFTFSKCPNENQTIDILGAIVPFGNKIILKCNENASFTVSAQIGEDLINPLSSANNHVVSGANVLVNLSGFYETVASAEHRQEMVKALSSKLACSYVLCNAGEGESTTDCVYAGQKIVAECGNLLLDSKAFGEQMLITEIDTGCVESEKAIIYKNLPSIDGYENVYFSASSTSEELTRKYSKTPFVPTEPLKLKERADAILLMQAKALKKRIEHTHASSVVLGLSGGLDSTLAILVCVNAIKELKRSPNDIIAITMPCFGTTSRTYQNTIKLAKALSVTLKKIDITKSVQRHLKDIKHKDGVYDTTFENAQARERTQVLMDVANMTNGLVIGTGDLSELALGWATYNGDHMSMYAVNCSIPKTLVRNVVENYAHKSKGKLKAVLLDILDTPVSPELLPAENDAISQKTEDIVGPYILHDFFLYNMYRRGFSPEKLYYVACQTFKGDFKRETILKWLKIFVRRFFNQQFKRSCLPDGVKVGSVSLSPRGEFKMPSDAVSALWLEQLENI